MIGGRFEVKCGDEVHVIEISSEGELTSLNDDHDVELERALQALGGEPSECLKWCDNHIKWIPEALEMALEEAFNWIFDSDQMEVHFSEQNKFGLALPEYAYEVEMDITRVSLETIGVSAGEARELNEVATGHGVDVSAYSSDTWIAGYVQLGAAPEGGIKALLPSDAVILIEGCKYNQFVACEVPVKALHYGLEDEVDSEGRLPLEVNYCYAIYTTQSHLDEKRNDEFQEELLDIVDEFSGYLDAVDYELADDDCEVAEQVIDESVFPTLERIANFVECSYALDALRSGSYGDSAYLVRIMNLCMTQLHGFEERCNIETPSYARIATMRVETFFKKLHHVLERE